jgi:phosphoribosylglycinamide formyltransferase 1
MTPAGNRPDADADASPCERVDEAGDRLRIAVMISGGGRTLVNLATCIERRVLDASIELVVSSRAEAPGVALARERGFDVRIATPPMFGDERAMHDVITQWLVERGIGLVCLAGYLRLMRVDQPYIGRVMNIHPALLPKFGGKGMYGLRVHEAVLAAGDRVSGCTVHFVNEEYDRGPVILQKTCPVLPGDTPESLAARVFELECKAYPEAVALFADGRIEYAPDRVRILPHHPPTAARRRHA